MSGFLRTLAGALVSLESEPGRAASRATDPCRDRNALDSPELLKQLNSSRPTTPKAPSAAPRPEGAPLVPASVMDMTADQVFAAAELSDTANSGQRLLRLIAALAMVPKPQQAVMLRALDAADDTWSERELLEDARQRQATLRGHLQSIDAERHERLQRVAANAEAAQAESRRAIEAIDRALGELQLRREQTIARVTAELSELEQQRQHIEAAALRARRGITMVIDAFGALITFFIGDEPTQVSKP